MSPRQFFFFVLSLTWVWAFNAPTIADDSLKSAPNKISDCRQELRWLREMGPMSEATKIKISKLSKVQRLEHSIRLLGVINELSASEEDNKDEKSLMEPPRRPGNYVPLGGVAGSPILMKPDTTDILNLAQSEAIGHIVYLWKVSEVSDADLKELIAKYHTDEKYAKSLFDELSKGAEGYRIVNGILVRSIPRKEKLESPKSP